MLLQQPYVPCNSGTRILFLLSDFSFMGFKGSM
jgi:hypothetical protein